MKMQLSLHVRDLNSYKYNENRKVNILCHAKLSYHLSHNENAWHIKILCH